LKAKIKNNKPDFYYEKKLKRAGYGLIIGIDEAGRGPLAGPVVAAAVALKAGERFKNRIDDSKKLTQVYREQAFKEISEYSLYGIGIVEEGMIDFFNILAATRMAMEQALFTLLDKIGNPAKQNPHIIVDGNVKLNIAFPYTNIPGGDAKSKSIACASILAKVVRDRIMVLYDKLYPEYGFRRHKGYPTRMHKFALRRFGPSGIHRKTFCLV